jgi:hypothetical protein
MITALFFVMGPAEMFAEAGANDEQPAVENVEGADDLFEVELVDPAEVETPEAPEAAEAESVENAEAVEGEQPEAVEAEGVEAAGGEQGEEPQEPAAEIKLTVTASDETAESVKLSWTFDEGQLAEGETLTIKYTQAGEEKIIEGVTGTSKEITGLTAATDYHFAFFVGEKEVGAADATTKAQEIPNFRTVSSYKKVYVRWDPVEGADSYAVKVVYKNNVIKDSTTTRTYWTHTGISPRDIVNLYNTCKQKKYKYSGNLDGQDRYTYTVTALDKDGNVLAESTDTGDIVKTLYYKLKFKNAATLTSHSGSHATRSFKKGQIVYANGFSDGKYQFDYEIKSGGKVETFHTMKIRVTASVSKHIAVDKAAKKNMKLRGTSTITYEPEEAEAYVNDRGVKKATTNYMIWANLFTQKEYVFKKSGGKWKLVTASGYGLNKQKMTALPVSTGKATAPTATGSTKINRKLPSQHGTPLWNVTKYFSVHGVQKSWPKTGWPESGACVRNRTNNAKWIYYTIPKYSRVFVH